MMILKYIFLIGIGLSAGMVISSAYAAFITSVGVVKYISVRTNTTNWLKAYKYVIVVSLLTGTVITLFTDIQFSLGIFGQGILITLGIFEGIFVGFIAMALAEVFDVFPIFNEKSKFKINLNYMIFAFAAGKMVGSFAYWLIPNFIK